MFSKIKIQFLITLLFLLNAACGAKPLAEKQSSELPDSTIEEVNIDLNGPLDDGDGTPIPDTNNESGQAILPILSPNEPSTPIVEKPKQTYLTNMCDNLFCEEREIGAPSAPDIYPRDLAPDSVNLSGFDQGSVKVMDVMEDISQAGSLYFNSYPVNTVDNLAFQSFPAGQDLEINFNFNDTIIQNIEWVEWQFYGIQCSNTSSYTINGTGNQGIGNRTANMHPGNGECVNITHISTTMNDRFGLIISSPPPGFQGILHYRIKLLNNASPINSLQQERVYFYIYDN